MANITVDEQHFILLGEIINDLELTKKPENIFNCNESVVAMDRHTAKVVVSRKTKQSYSESKGTTDHITVNACVSADGLLLPLHIIFAGAFPSGLYARENPDGALYSVSNNSYMDSMLFYVFMDQLFAPKTRHIAGQKLLILDGHGLYLDINTIQLCRANNIHLHCLPPHTTHIFQPLNVVIFHPVKSNFSRLTHSMSSLPHLDGKKQ